MKMIRQIIIGILRFFTFHIQLKGVPKFILFIKGALFRKDEAYKAYNNIKITIDPTVGFHCLNVLNYGGYEAVKLFEKFLKKGDVFIDIGANLGYMSLNAEKLVGAGGKVISFEPDPSILPVLKRNKIINHSDILICEKAVGDREGTEVFNIATESGLSRLDNKQHNQFGLELVEQITIEMTTLDDFLQEVLPERPVKFIKIDVEGHELRILKGAQSSLGNYKPALFLEINHEALKQNEVTYLDIFDFLKRYSYQFYFVDSHGADWLRLNRKPTCILIGDDHKRYADIPFDLLCLSSEMASQLDS